VFILCCSTVLLVGECVLFVLGLVFSPYEAKRLAWGNVCEMTYFLCRVGRKTTAQSVNQAPCSTRSSVTADGPCKRAVAVKCPVHTARQIRQDSAVSVVSDVAV